MVDNDARRKTLEILKKLETEKLTNWQLEDMWPKSSIDPAINCILRWLWTLYDDNLEYVVIDKLTDAEKNILARCRNFLATEIDFPIRKRSIFERIKLKYKMGVEWRSDCTFPDNGYWPFPSQEG